MPQMTRKEQIHAKALEILKAETQGIRYTLLVTRVHEAFPDIPLNTIYGNLWSLDAQLPKQVYKPARGIYRLLEYLEPEEAEEQPPTPPKEEKLKEERFYEPFADWLVNDLEECTKAIPVGGNLFKDKWGTPDVIGIREPKKSDIIKFPTEIVSVEVKLDPASLITAFGQACAYRLFSHKSYLVVPHDSPEDDLARLDTLARIFGIGLILFDPVNPNEPAFDIRVRAVNHEPDMFYVNRYMRIIEDDLFS
jgi:hypothetical protein